MPPQSALQIYWDFQRVYSLREIVLIWVFFFPPEGDAFRLVFQSTVQVYLILDVADAPAALHVQVSWPGVTAAAAFSLTPTAWEEPAPVLSTFRRAVRLSRIFPLPLSLPHADSLLSFFLWNFCGIYLHCDKFLIGFSVYCVPIHPFPT